MPRLIIAETRSSSWHYHLREIPEGEGPKYGGLPWSTPAVCGNTFLGWDTEIPLERWGVKPSHIPMVFCKECSEILAKKRSGKG